MIWFVDGNNVMGAGARGWWNDREGAAVRLTQRLGEWARTRAGEEIVVVFDGSPAPAVAALGGGNLTVTFATRSGRDAADDRIVELAAERYADPDGVPAITVVTSDRGLRERLPPGVATIGAGDFLRRLDFDTG